MAQLLSKTLEKPLSKIFELWHHHLQQTMKLIKTFNQITYKMCIYSDYEAEDLHKAMCNAETND